MDDPTPAAPGRWFLCSAALLLVVAQAAAAQGVGTTETWLVHTRGCPQEPGTDPWTCLSAAPLDSSDREVAPLGDPRGVIARIDGRPVVILVHGNSYDRQQAVEEGVRVRDRLGSAGALDPDTLFVIFHWPSERTFAGLARDLNEKSRRSRVAAFHLASLIQAFPTHSRITLLGQSDGARVTLSAVHLLGGATLPAILREPAIRLNAGRPDLRFRLVLLDTAVGHSWLNPGSRLGGAVPASEAVLNLYNRHDLALLVYPYGLYTGLQQALGRVGLTPHDRARLGPLADRVSQYELHGAFGPRHVLFPDALAVPELLGLVAAYTRWGPASFP